MKEYTSCFVGIPLSAQYQDVFEKLLKDISKIDPLVETAYPKTPHITGYYLDKQSQFVLPKIIENIELKVNLLKSIELTIGGFGYFRGNDPRVIFLNVQFPEALTEFNDVLVKSLSSYHASDNNLPFHPHMTVARLRTPASQESFKTTEPQLRSRLNEVCWTFPVTEVVVYGVDSTKSSQYQEKLVHIPVW